MVLECEFAEVLLYVTPLICLRLQDALTEETYNAELAGLKCELELGTFGTNMKVSGRRRYVETLIGVLVCASLLCVYLFFFWFASQACIFANID